MSERSDRELISDIREAIQRISDYLTGFDYASFVNDTKTQDAVIRNLEILGEATKRWSEALRAKPQELEAMECRAQALVNLLP